MKNPYIWNAVHPELCYGRDAILGEILGGLPGSPRFSFGLAGGRRMGKSTLLRRVESELRAGIEQWQSGGLLVIPIYIDGLALPRPLTTEYLWQTLADEILSVATDSMIKVITPDFSAFKKELVQALTNLDTRPRVIVMFDEVEPILAHEWADGFFANWRALLSNTPGLSEYFTAIFAGARELSALQRDVGSPIKDILEWRSLRPLDFEDACRLMQEPCEMTWPQPLMEDIYRETGGHPMLLQYVMQQICAHTGDINNEIVRQAALRFSRDRRWQFSEWWERSCTDTARRVYARLPDDASPIPLRTLTREFGLGQTDDALEILQHVGLAIGDDEGLSYRYCGEMFRRWYRAHGSLDQDAQHDPRICALLRTIADPLADKYVSAWGIFQSNLPNYSGVLVELRGVLEYLADLKAPDDVVQSEPDFRLETGHTKPTLRQRLRYMARQLYSSADLVKEIVSNYNLLEITCEQLAQTLTIAHRTASGMAHHIATRDMAYRALKQWDGLLAQLLPDDPYT